MPDHREVLRSARGSPPSAFDLLPFLSPWVKVAVVITILLASGAPLHAGNAAPQANCELKPEELEAIKTLFEKFASAFNQGDAHAVSLLFINRTSHRHAKLLEGLEREFRDTGYSEFTIVTVSPDETLNRIRHSIDVTMRMKIEDRGKNKKAANAPAAGSDALPTDQFTTTTEAFIVQKLDDGSFGLIDSSYFDKLGLRQGIGIVADTLLAIMGLVAALAFWVWMGFEVSWARPRSRLWRTLVYLVPVFGAVAFFCIKYLPRHIGSASSGFRVPDSVLRE
jgi:hypothetical protein